MLPQEEEDEEEHGQNVEITFSVYLRLLPIFVYWLFLTCSLP